MSDTKTLVRSLQYLIARYRWSVGQWAHRQRSRLFSQFPSLLFGRLPVGGGGGRNSVTTRVQKMPLPCPTVGAQVTAAGRQAGYRNPLAEKISRLLSRDEQQRKETTTQSCSFRIRKRALMSSHETMASPLSCRPRPRTLSIDRYGQCWSRA